MILHDRTPNCHKNHFIYKQFTKINIHIRIHQRTHKSIKNINATIDYAMYKIVVKFGSNLVMQKMIKNDNDKPEFMTKSNTKIEI